tara:strand:+ start:129 stop:569 length:441 start_codon:yes stop_codon:yes gene_type:complete
MSAETVFAYLDKSSLGKLATSELGPALRTLAYNPTAKQMTKLCEVHAADGTFDITALNAIMVALDAEPISAEKVTAAFTIFDEEGGGLLERAAFKEILKTSGDMMTEEDAEAAVQLADPHNTGKVDYAGFIALLFRENVPVQLLDS